MTQVARNLTDGVDGFLIGKRYLLQDRDPLFTDEFRGVLAAAGVKCLRLPRAQSRLEFRGRTLCALDQVGVLEQAGATG